MKPTSRRRFLKAGSVASALGMLSGCLGLSGILEDQSAGPEPDRPVYEPDAETSDDYDWRGGSKRARELQSSVYQEGFQIEVYGATAHQQLGVYFGEPVTKSSLSDGDFEWLQAGDESYLWTFLMTCHQQDGYNGEVREAIPPKKWTASKALETSEEVLPFSVAFDEYPTYYREIDRDTTRAMNAYTNTEASASRVLAFEVPSRYIEVALDTDIRAEWEFEVR